MRRAAPPLLDLWSALPKRASPALSWSKPHRQQPVGLCRARSIVAPPSIGLSTLAAWKRFPCVSLGLPVSQRCQLRNRDEIRRRLIINFSCVAQFPLKMDAVRWPGEPRSRWVLSRLSPPPEPPGGPRRRPSPPCPSPGREAGVSTARTEMAATKVSARFSAPTPSFWCGNNCPLAQVSPGRSPRRRTTTPAGPATPVSHGHRALTGPGSSADLRSHHIQAVSLPQSLAGAHPQSLAGAHPQSLAGAHPSVSCRCASPVSWLATPTIARARAHYDSSSWLPNRRSYPSARPSGFSR